jgi:hypothetical protein
MDKGELLEFLREHLKIEVSTRATSDWGSKGYDVEVTLLLGDEVISQHKDSIEMAYRDTSESWRSPLD